MKTLLLMRHAKSSWDDESLSDHERTLNDRGRRDAPRMGRLLKAEKLIPQRILTSSATRAQATAKLLVHEIKHAGPMIVDDDLYHATVATVLTTIQRQPDDVDVLLVVGHNPNLESLVLALLRRRELIPTAAIIRIDYEFDRWSDLSPESIPEAFHIWRPKELD
ncbi:MAG: histidine phosphatase family protein [Planctomycetaceae bacterium]